MKNKTYKMALLAFEIVSDKYFEHIATLDGPSPEELARAYSDFQTERDEALSVLGISYAELQAETTRRRARKHGV